MLRPDRTTTDVYLHRAPIDMRRQIDGLAALVEGVMKQNPLSGSLFAFINKRRDKLKILMWERNGFIVWYKRLEAREIPMADTVDQGNLDPHRRAIELVAWTAMTCGG